MDSKKLDILVIEDSSDDYFFLCRELKKCGYKLKSKRVESETELRSALSNEKWDLILSDNRLPSMTALNTVQISKEILPETPFVIYSGTLSEESAVEAFKIGANNFVIKGNVNRLISVVEYELNEAQLKKERYNSSIRIREAEGKLSQITNSINDIFIATDLKGQCQYWNEKAVEFTGIPSNEAINHNLTALLSILDSPNLITKVERAILSKEPLFFNQHLKCNNRSGYFSISIRPTENVISLLFRDITDIYSSKQKLADSNNDLKTILYKLSHDLKGPIASSLGLLHLTRIDPDISNNSEYLEKVEISLQRLNGILDSLTNLSRLKSDKVIFTGKYLEKEIVKIKDSIKNQEVYDKTKFHLEINSAIEFHTDWNVFYPVIQNIIENAFKYSQKRRNPEVTVKVINSDDNLLVISVSDNGTGISQESQKLIFDLFYRADDSTQGSGLGLYIAKEGTEKLGGSIELKSAVNVGTTFTLKLPVISSQNVIMNNPKQLLIEV